MDALHFIVHTLLELYTITFVLRFLLQWTRADFSNPLSQFIVQVTDPLVRPVRRLVRGWRGLDLSTLLLAYLLQIVTTTVSGLLRSGALPGNAVVLLLWSAVDLLLLGLRLFEFLIIGQVLLSWFAPYNPIGHVLRTMTAPVLRPIQRFIPPIANIDLSPLVALLGLHALVMLVQGYQPLVLRLAGL